MRFWSILPLMLALPFLLLAPLALAHSPLTTGDNESLATATIVPDPAKSWAIYGELHEGGEAQYYRFDIAEGQRIYVGLLITTDPEDRGFTPGLILMGPGIVSQGTVPDYVEVPEGVGSLAVEGRQPEQAEYEPFAPSSFYSLAEVDLDAPGSGTYYIAVYEPSRGGHYSVAIGYVEAYNLDEYILIPVSLISVYQWEGQSLVLIFAPMAATVVVGLGLLARRWRNQAVPRTPSGWVGALAGLLYMGSGATVLFQMAFSLTRAPAVPGAALTIVFASMPILLGIGILRIVLRKRKMNTRARAYLAILGILAFFAWAGLLVGPVLALLASVLPYGGSDTETP